MLVVTGSGDSGIAFVGSGTGTVVVAAEVDGLGAVGGTALGSGVAETELDTAGGTLAELATVLCVGCKGATDVPGPNGADDATPEGVLGGIVAKTTGTVKVGAPTIAVDEVGSVDEFVTRAGKSSTEKSGTISSVVPATSLNPRGNTGAILAGKSSAMRAGSGRPTIWAETSTA